MEHLNPSLSPGHEKCHLLIFTFNLGGQCPSDPGKSEQAGQVTHAFVPCPFPRLQALWKCLTLMWICNWRQSGFGSLVHRALDLPMCLPPVWHNCVSSPELPSAHYACTDYRLVWLNECTCVYIFYICTVYIYSVYVYIGVYYVYRHVATYPNSPCFKENLW